MSQFVMQNGLPSLRDDARNGAAMLDPGDQLNFMAHRPYTGHSSAGMMPIWLYICTPATHDTIECLSGVVSIRETYQKCTLL